MLFGGGGDCASGLEDASAVGSCADATGEGGATTEAAALGFGSAAAVAEGAAGCRCDSANAAATASATAPSPATSSTDRCVGALRALSPVESASAPVRAAACDSSGTGATGSFAPSTCAASASASAAPICWDVDLRTAGEACAAAVFGVRINSVAGGGELAVPTTRAMGRSGAN